MLAKDQVAHLPHLPAFRATPLVFFSCTTFERRRILDNLMALKILIEIWENSAEHNGWFVGHYLLMPDHIHLFARPAPDANPMSQWMQMWKSVSSRRISKMLKIAPPLWQKDYFDRYIRSSENYTDKWNYVYANPVRAGLVANSDNWPFKGMIYDLRF